MKKDQTTDNGKSVLGPGTKAPDFTLKCTPDQSVSLSDFRGAPVILAFYPADWSPVCGDQLALYNEVLPEFKRFAAALLGISVDGAGVMPRTPRTADCTSRFSLISTLKERQHRPTARIGTRTAYANAHCS
jgi:peroxiredoxin